MNHPEPATSPMSSKKTAVGSVFVSNYPPFSSWRRERVDAALSALHQPASEDAAFGLYLHIPFCRKRCKFCYFRVYTDKNADEIGGYLNALASEIEHLAQLPALVQRSPRFIYFGGGTPSYIGVDHLVDLVQRLRRAMDWSTVQEITFECEPGTLTRTKLAAIRDTGVTRLSLGIESFDDEILRENGRAHLSKEIYRCLPWIDALRFDQLNIDLIAGMVGEHWDSWRDTVARTVDIGADSVTVYQMELPYNTRFSDGILRGSFDRPLADWDLKRAWHDYAFEELAKAGYELSSAYTMVRDTRRCRFVYRDSVWRGCDLLGTGVASFSHLQGVHYQNVDGWGEYLALSRQGRLPISRAYPTSPRERLIREMILQLKLGEIQSQYFLDKFGVEVTHEFREPLRRLEQRGLLSIAKGSLTLSRKGLLQVDALLPEFYEPPHRGARYT